jgi:hypothetical protein
LRGLTDGETATIAQMAQHIGLRLVLRNFLEDIVRVSS